MSKEHLAGVIPVANIQTDFDMKIPELMLPIGPGFNLIQKSVFECAIAGCNTIWIVANEDLAPIIKKVVGEWTYDPVYYSGVSKFSSEQRKEIPIYYVPIHPKDRERRDSYGWSILYGIHSAWKVANNLSQWLIPDKYYVSFPMAVYDIYAIRQWRRLISAPGKNFFLMSENNHIKNNLVTSFTLTGEDFKLCRRAINKKTTREYLPPSPGQQYPTKKLPLDQRWSARKFNLQDIFSNVSEDEATYINLEWFYDVSSWKGYRNFMSSEYIIEPPNKELTKPRTHVKLPYVQEG